MDSQKVEIFLNTNSSKFKPEHLAQIKSILDGSDDNKYQLLLSLDLKEPSTMLIISLLGGGLGIDRFMLGDTGLGIAKLLTLGGCGIWALIDLFSVQDRTRDYNFQLFMQALA